MRQNAACCSLLGLALASACADQPDTSTAIIETIAPDGARIIRAEVGTLTPASASAEKAIVAAFLRGRGVVDELTLTTQFVTASGISHLRLEQSIDGLRVFGSYVKASLDDRGQLVHVIDHTWPLAKPVAAVKASRDALDAAFVALGYPPVQLEATVAGNTTHYAKTAELHRGPTVERVAYVNRETVREGFLVETWAVEGNQLDYTLVDGDGSVISIDRRTSNDRYNVFVEDPDKAGQTIVTGGIRPGSPAGWLGAGAQLTQNISGNNVHSYLDTDANNTPDPTGAAVADGDFLSAADVTASPATDANRNVAVQNLFFLNNIVHDVLYGHGFNEAAGNFQVDNFGNGGTGGDPVNAEAQDGSGLDNANFATPNEGQSPRMQMFLWSGTTPPGVVTVGGTDFAAFTSSFGAQTTPTGVTGALALVNDGVGTTSDGCEASPRGSMTGLVAVVDRGTCNFTVKVLNAQQAGAVAVVIANNIAGNAFSAGGTDRKIKISSAMVGLDDGASIKAQLGTAATLRTNPVPPLRIDGDVDSDVVFHEYGHGLTQRMIGGMNGPLAGAIGEGASDTVAFLINGDDRVGEYAFQDPLGIRRQPYSTYVGSYATTVTGAEVHNDGELYAAAMFRVLTNYQAAGLTASDVLDDFVGGMNFTPATPAYENMRDGMLQVAPAARQCLIWEAFAHYGVGVGAVGRVTKGGRAVTITESFAVPPTCP